jgi:cytochrome b561
MSWRNSDTRYSPWIIGLHWLMLLLLAAVCACMELRGLLTTKGSPQRADMMSLHYLLGLSVFVFVALRIIARWRMGPEPPIRPPMPVWQDGLAYFMKLVLYLFMIVMPVLGWLALSAEGKPIVLFGLSVPSLITGDEALHHQLKEVHETLATVGYFLIGGHAAAALIHHFITRDNTLLRMLPGGRARQR